MNKLEKTTLYKDTVATLKNYEQTFSKSSNSTLHQEATKKALRLLEGVIDVITATTTKKQNEKIQESITIIQSLIAYLNLSEIEQATPLKEQLYTLEQAITAFPKNQKNILILTVNIGQGHISVAKSTKEALEFQYGYDYNIEIIDFMEFVSSFMNKTTQKIYDSSTKFTPQLYKFIFDSTDKEWQIKLFNILNYPFLVTKLKKLFEDKSPDLLISTYPLWEYLISEIWKKQSNGTPFINIITDSISIHSSWITGKPDYHIVANQDTAEVVEKMGAPKEKIKALGFPIRLRFLKTSTKEEFTTKYKLSPQKFTLLYLATAEPSRKILSTLDQLKKNKDLQVLLVTGRNKKITPKIREEVKEKHIHIFGWVDDLPDFMAHSDIIITKAGGSTVTECIAMEKPMIITQVIPGQEEGNAELVKRHNLGVVLPEEKITLPEAIKKIKRENLEMHKNLKKLKNPDAALKIASFIHEKFFS